MAQNTPLTKLLIFTSKRFCTNIVSKAFKHNSKHMSMCVVNKLIKVNLFRVSDVYFNNRYFCSRTAEKEFQKVAVQDASRFMVDCMTAVGTSRNGALRLAELLLEADTKGHFSHGLNRLEMYVNDVKNKTCDPNAEPQILNETQSTAWVDGKNGLGVIIGNFCMQLAIKKAKDTGIACVVTKGSNHYGIASWYSEQALEQGMLGISCTNTSPLMSPTRSKEAALGTNPISLAAPAKEDSFVLDMATTAVAVGKIEIEMKKNAPIPEGWAQGRDGKSTTNAKEAFETSCLMPLGGSELTGGYKGYGLGLLVEVLCGILSGSKFGPFIRSWQQPGNEDADLGQCFIAINPKCFCPNFEDRMSTMNEHLRNMHPVDTDKPVLVPGDPERKQKKTVSDQGGIKYHSSQVERAEILAKSLGVIPMKTD